MKTVEFDVAVLSDALRSQRAYGINRRPVEDNGPLQPQRAIVAPLPYDSKGYSVLADLTGMDGLCWLAELEHQRTARLDKAASKQRDYPTCYKARLKEHEAAHNRRTWWDSLSYRQQRGYHKLTAQRARLLSDIGEYEDVLESLAGNYAGTVCQRSCQPLNPYQAADRTMAVKPEAMAATRATINGDLAGWRPDTSKLDKLRSVLKSVEAAIAQIEVPLHAVRASSKTKRQTVKRTSELQALKSAAAAGDTDAQGKLQQRRVADAARKLLARQAARELKALDTEIAAGASAVYHEREVSIV